MKPLVQSVRLLVFFSLLCGLAYPLVVTVVATAAFPAQANGSLVRDGGMIRGSSLIGQPFDDPAYFWGRPSATTPSYNAAASSGSNIGSNNLALREAIEGRILALRQAGTDPDARIPTELVTSSASGLDPHISPEATDFQVQRVARARDMSEEDVRRLVAANTDGRQFGALGEPVVNVLRLNLALDAAAVKESR